jgi:prophage regulatory protein
MSSLRINGTPIGAILAANEASSADGSVAASGAPTPNPAKEAKILREKEVEAITGLSRTTRWRLRRRGEFPNPRKLTDNTRGYLDHEIYGWVSSRPPAI